MNSGIKKERSGSRTAGGFFDAAIIIILLIAAAAGIYFILSPGEKQTVKLEYKITFETVDKRHSSAITGGSELLSESGVAMGKVTEIKNDGKIFITTDRSSADEGGYITNVSDKYNTVKATVAAEAVFDGGSYYVGGTSIKAGERIVLRVPDYYGTALITAVTPEE